ncbi:MAG: PKD domain-containing protein, partial [Halobacteriota archaeon]
MRKSDYPKVLRRGVAVMAILLLLLLLLGAFAPAAMAADWPNCDWIQTPSCDAEFPPNKSCVANDGRINKAWLGYCNNATPIEPCTPGALVDNVCIWAEFNKGPLRYQIYSFFDLYIDDQYQGSYCDCNDTIPFKTHVNRSIYGPLQWTCGQELELKNVLVAWTVNSDCNCSDPACCNSSCDCEQGHPKCWGPKEIIVRAPLVANFTTAPQCYCTNITFNGTATGGSPSYSYSWVFGDGNSDTGQNTSHHYGAAGTYTVNLTVTDSGTNTTTVSKDVQVWPTPVADFTTNPPQQIYCHPFTFNDTTTGGTLPYQNWSWDFDDGSYSYQQNTSHTYSANGTYNVTLTVKDAHNCTNSTIKTVVALNYTADLKITKTANVSSATVGTVIGYNITVNNTGNVNLTSVLVTDSLTGLS